MNVTYWHKDFLEGLESCRVTDSKHAFPKHVHDDMYSIGLMHGGGCYCVSNADSDTIVLPDETVFINPSQVHSGIPLGKGRATYTMLYFKNELMAKLAGDILERQPFQPEFSDMVVSSPAVHGSFLSLYNAFCIPRRAWSLRPRSPRAFHRLSAAAEHPANPATESWYAGQRSFSAAISPARSPWRIWRANWA
ncbi:MAG: AraC family ligand binding domain-containing protein [Geovibrio sp.]|nr:AraC family ligand binding domain-containing protein [Geovibrio sp.]